MTGFDGNWLTLREPLDKAARNRKILSLVLDQYSRSPLQIADIGTGTGSTLRALQPNFKNQVHWHLIDNDPRLLDVARQSLQGLEADVTCADLSETLEPIFQFEPDLVTTSAFLDLVSADWLSRLASELAMRNLPFYAALTYDGRVRCTPAHDLDEEIRGWVNLHQTGDKGFGPALGPDAGSRTVEMFQDMGYDVRFGGSDWRSGPHHAEFQKLLVMGWHEAACEVAPENTQQISDWLAFRLGQIEDGQSYIEVGHIDLLALPPGHRQ